MVPTDSANKNARTLYNLRTLPGDIFIFKAKTIAEMKVVKHKNQGP